MITGLADAQLGLVDRRALHAAGLGPAAVARHVAAGRLHVLGPQTLRVAGAPRTADQLALAGLLDLGPTAALSRGAAGRVLRFDGFAGAVPQYTMPRGTWRPHPRWRVHATRSLPDCDLVTVGILRVTSAARTIVDLAATSPPAVIEAAIGSALRDRWTSEPVLRRRFGELRSRGRAGGRALDAVLDGRPVGHTHLERLFLNLVAGAGLPPPTIQVVHRDDGRFVARVDAQWAAAKLVVEVHGTRPHATAAQQQRDAQRATELQLAGWRVLTFTYHDITTRPAWVVARLRQALADLTGGLAR